jgi:short-subunit dehydrogenase
MLDVKKYGPWALVCGASQGVGESFALKLAAEGLNLVLVSRQQPLLEEVAERVRTASGVQVRTLAMDLTSPEMLYKIIEVTEDIEVGLLVYNAGANQSMQKFFDGPLDAALRVVRLNPIGQVQLCYHFGKKMMQRKRGGIILVGSLASSASASPLVAYCASKAFCQSFGEGLWSELKPHGVDVLYEVLGGVNTPNLKIRRAEVAGTAQQLGGEHPLQVKHGLVAPITVPFEPDEVAQGALDNIANGPVHVPERLRPHFETLNSLPRGEASELQATFFKI